MPILIKRLLRITQPPTPTKSYDFELTKEETSKFLTEFLSDFWVSDKVPDDEEVTTVVSFKIEFHNKKEVEDYKTAQNVFIQKMKDEAMHG